MAVVLDILLTLKTSMLLSDGLVSVPSVAPMNNCERSATISARMCSVVVRIWAKPWRYQFSKVKIYVSSKIFSERTQRIFGFIKLKERKEQEFFGLTSCCILHTIHEGLPINVI